MRILQVIPSMAVSTGGPPVAVANLTTELQSLGCKVTVATTDLSTSAQAHHIVGNVRQDQMPAGSEKLDICIFRTSRLSRWAHSPAISTYFHRHLMEYDIVHIHSLNLHTQFSAYQECIRSSVPYVVTPHGALDPYIQSSRPALRKLIAWVWQQQMLERAAMLHFGSQQELDRGLPFFSNSRVELIPNGIALPKADSETTLGRALPRPVGRQSRPHIVNHGRIANKKGLDVLIRAVGHAQNAYPGITLTLIGPDDENLSPRLRELTSALGIQELVTFTGPLYGNELFSVLKSADLWALPSWSEGASIAVNEALAIGLPVVVSPYVANARDAAEAGALRIVENTPLLLSQEIVHLLQNHVLRESLSQSAHAYASELSWQSLAPRFLRMYERSVGHRGNT